MLDLARHEARKRVRGSIYLSITMSVLAVFVIWAYPSFREGFDDPNELLDAYPEQVVRAFDIETIASIEGFLAFELYVFGWIILLGLYLAYLAAGTVSGAIERGRIDMLLALPISRTSAVGNLFLALLVPIIVVNVTVPFVVIASSIAIGESVSVGAILLVHLVSIPYLLACATVGIAASVVFDRADIAQRVSLGIVFGLYLVESLLGDTDYANLGVVAPSRHYDPNEILLDTAVSLTGVGIMLGMTGMGLLLSVSYFKIRDIP